MRRQVARREPSDTPSGPPETPPPTTRMAPTRDFACQTEPWSICLESTILREACIDGPCKVDRAWWHAVQHSHVSAKEREVVEEKMVATLTKLFDHQNWRKLLVRVYERVTNGVPPFQSAVLEMERVYDCFHSVVAKQLCRG